MAYNSLIKPTTRLLSINIELLFNIMNTDPNFTPYRLIETNDVDDNDDMYSKVFTNCGPDDSSEPEQQSCRGHLLYIGTICLTFLMGYWIQRSPEIGQRELTCVELYGDICTVAFLSFAISLTKWHGFEKLTCLSKRQRRDFWCGVLRYILFVVTILSTTAVYGIMRNIPLFQSSLNAELSDEQFWVYIVLFSLMFLIFGYWIFKIISCHSTKAYCNPRLENKIAFLRLLIVLTAVTVMSYIVCAADESCDWHLHHYFFGIILVMLSSPLLDNWFDLILHGVFWMLILETQWHWTVSLDSFFI